MAVVLITGAGKGIGLATASAFAKRGDLVYAGLRSLDNLPPELKHSGIHPLRLEVTSEADITAAMVQMTAIFGFPDILINNAGINRPGTVEETGIDIWQQIFNVNFFAPIRLCQTFLPAMRQSGKGCIIMLSSLSAEIGLPYDGPYAASKAALNRAAECLAAEVKPFGIRIIVAEPGAVKTNLNNHHRDIDNPLPDYHLLNEYMQSQADQPSRGEDPYAIAEEILALVDDPHAPLTCPMGQQARKIAPMINQASFLEREQIIRDASGLEWWMTRKHKVKNKGK